MCLSLLEIYDRTLMFSTQPNIHPKNAYHKILTFSSEPKSRNKEKYK